MNYFYHNGYYYSTIANTGVDGSRMDCQGNYLSLPKGWTIAPDNKFSKEAINASSWNTQYVVVSSGVGYYSRHFNVPYSNSMLFQSSFQTDYYCSPCNCEILIVLESTFTPTKAPVPSNSYSAASTTSSTIISSILFWCCCCLFPFLYYRMYLTRPTRVIPQRSEEQPHQPTQRHSILRGRRSHRHHSRCCLCCSCCCSSRVGITPRPVAVYSSSSSQYLSPVAVSATTTTTTITTPAMAEAEYQQAFFIQDDSPSPILIQVEPCLEAQVLSLPQQEDDREVHAYAVPFAIEGNRRIR